MIPLPESFIKRPLAHRALHDAASGLLENSLGAVRAATWANYGIEIDIQLSRDGVAMVFHDYDLGRLTQDTGPVAQRTAAELGQITLKGMEEGIPTLAQVLAEVEGRSPLLIEIKDQDGNMGGNTGTIEAAIARALEGYSGDVALMSFNPHAVAHMAKCAPTRPRGLTTCAFVPSDWPTLPETLCAELAKISDYERVGASFISHDVNDLGSARVKALKSNGAKILTWTVRSPEQEAKAREVADNITFEGYRAPF
ncbi:MAG: glycerophosphodiester phosphodiesterase family protein [Maritimibacter sp.]